MSHYGAKNGKWESDYRLISVTYPSVNQAQYYFKRRFVIIIHYESPQVDNKGKHVIRDGKTVMQKRQKTIYFGLRDVPSKIDGVDVSKRKSNRKIRTDIFHPYFWQRQLLQTKQTIQEAYVAVLVKLGLIK